MAIGKVQKTQDFSNNEVKTVKPIYTGISKVKIIAVNPTKEELEIIYKIPQNNEPIYHAVNEAGIKVARIDFYLQNTEKDINFIQRCSFFLTDTKQISSKGTAEVINSYGQTAYIDKSFFETGDTQLLKSWFLPQGIRPTYIGENLLTNFLKVYLNIPSITRMDQSGNYVPIDNLSDANMQLEHINDYFNGNFSELKDIMKDVLDTNIIKVVIGIKTVNNKQYMFVYPGLVLRSYDKNISKFKTSIENDQNYNKYNNVEFTYNEIKEYIVIPTDLEAKPIISKEPITELVSDIDSSFDEEMPF